MKRYGFLLLLLLSLTVACKNEDSDSVKIHKDEILFTKEGSLTITDKDASELASFDIEIADTEYETQTGLMYRSSMEENQGMLFIFENVRERYFYMKNTYIALDIIYITPDKKIATLVKNAKPLDESDLPSEVPVKYVLEINAGIADKLKISKGDLVSWNEK